MIERTRTPTATDGEPPAFFTVMPRSQPHESAETTDTLLTERLMQGDRDALTELLNRHQKRLYNVILRMVRHPEDAAELTQDTMLKILQHADRYSGRSQITTWMIRIAMNVSISHLRKRKLRQTTSLDSTPGHAQNGNGHTPPRLSDALHNGSELSPDQRVEQNEMLNLLHESLDAMDPDLKAVLVLRDIDQLDYAHMAETLEVPVGTVKSRLFRARLALRQEMHRRVGEPVSLQSGQGNGDAA